MPSASRMLKRSITSVGVVVVLLVGGVSGSAFADGTSVVGGTVTSAGQPLAGVDVSVYPAGSGTGRVAETTTSAAGSYFVSVADGTWDFLFTPPAPFAPVTKSGVTVSGDHTLDVVLVQDG